ncbi:MAG: hypothetical protein RLZZ157_1928, partial [Pseudomonadota bacterium]
MANRDSFDDFDSDDDDDGFLTFDAREEEEDRSRGPLIIAAVVAALAICGLILWQLYKGGRDAGSPPQIAADTNSFKAAPADPGGEVTADLDKGVYDAADGTTAPPLDVMPKALEEDPLLADGGAIPAKPATAPTKATVPPPVVTPKPAPKPAPTQTTPAKAPATQIAQATPAVAKPKPVEVAAAAPKT